LVVTPSGIESIPDITKQPEDSSSPTENRETRSSKKRVVTLTGSKVAKIAAMARNALRNYDLHRAIEVLEPPFKHEPGILRLSVAWFVSAVNV
jgi:hypothetical protein